jgi:hypothetical protein
MTKKECLKKFRKEVMPDYKGRNIVAVRAAFNDYVGSLHYLGAISAQQAGEWHYPRQSYYQRQLAAVPKSERKVKRLQLDFAKMLVGPTCGAEAARLAEMACPDQKRAESLAKSMLAAASKFLRERKQ